VKGNVRLGVLIATDGGRTVSTKLDRPSAMAWLIGGSSSISLRMISSACSLHRGSIRGRTDLWTAARADLAQRYWRSGARRLPYLLFVLLLFVLLLSMTVVHLPSAPGASILNV
jgi:hypothetical protein